MYFNVYKKNNRQQNHLKFNCLYNGTGLKDSCGECYPMLKNGCACM